MSMAMEQAIKILKSDLAIQKEFKALPDHIEALEMVIKFIEQDPTTKNDLAHNLCDSCTNIGCEFQSGIVRTKCVFYMPPHIESDNCGNYIIQKPTTKNDLGVDCISRQAVLDLIADYDLSMGQVVKGIHALPSVTSQKQKTGHWIDTGSGQECSECGEIQHGYDNFRYFCAKCGMKMEVKDERFN